MHTATLPTEQSMSVVGLLTAIFGHSRETILGLDRSQHYFYILYIAYYISHFVNTLIDLATMEKQASQTPLLPQATSRLTTSSKKPTKRSPALIALFLLLGFLGQQWLSQAWTSIYQPTHNFDALKDACPQPEPLLPSAHNVSSVWNHKERIIKWHQGAIRIPTEVQDVMGEPGEDRRWDIFADFHECKLIHCDSSEVQADY